MFFKNIFSSRVNNYLTIKSTIKREKYRAVKV